MSEYITIKPNHRAGMFSFIWETLKIIKMHPDEKIYIDFSESIYKKNFSDNAWDYFFEQPHISIKPRDNQIKNIFYSNYVDYLYSNINNKKYLEYYFNNIDNENEIIRRNEYNNIIKKYCILKKNIKEKIDNFYNINFLSKKVLGIHIRGTDHPYKLDETRFIKEIEKYADLYDVYYVSTDEYNRYKAVKDRFGDKVITYNSIKSDSCRPLHNANYPICEKTYQSGEDVIVEAYLLSKSNFLLCLPLSNVNYFAIYSNLNLKYSSIFQ